MKRIDFDSSFITWLTKENSSYGRFSIDAVNIVTNVETGAIQEFYLLSSVFACSLYNIQSMVKNPPYYFSVIFSNKQFKRFRFYENFSDPDEKKNEDVFEKVNFDINYKTYGDISSEKKIVEATLDNEKLYAKVLIKSTMINQELFFPIKHNNVRNVDKLEFQVETGPVAILDDEETEISGFSIGYIAFNNLFSYEIICPNSKKMNSFDLLIEKKEATISIFNHVS